ncbi:type VI secretion system-associated protein TagF [Kalamiella sp. sgz302252]|uniref:type VI secretion system-associated protein TagF n=1 Tax=Pantoea sp. sgz302252 TaxID=3341827 RepID=UPI0036D28FD8
MSQTPAPCWYGKLPSGGDFLKRRFTDALLSQWSNWFQVGLLHRQENTEGERQFADAPVWNFVVPPMLGSQQIQMGCLLPSRDNVGRLYPLCALTTFTPQSWAQPQLAMAGAWYQQLGRILLNAVRESWPAAQLDNALLALPLPQVEQRQSEILEAIGYQERPSTLSWRRVSDCFDPQHYTSFWWTNQADGQPLYTHVHSGNFTGQLFSMLFDPAAGAKPGRQGLYPPMFE